MGSGDRGRRKEWIVGVFLLALTLVNLAYVVRLAPLLRKGYQDFTAFYTAGVVIRNGQSARLYDLVRQYDIQKQFAPDVAIRKGVLPYNHPSVEALVFAPLAYLGYWPAYLVWGALNVGMLLVSLGMVARTFPHIAKLHPAFLLVSATAFVPVVTGFMQGTDSVLLLFALVVGLILLEKNRDVAAGAALAAGLFKFHLVLPIAFLLALRRPKLLLGFVPIAVGLCAVSVDMVGWSGMEEYARLVFRLEKSGAGGAIIAAGMPNLRGLVGVLTPQGWSGELHFSLTVACSVLALGIAAWQVRRPSISLVSAFAIASVAGILVSFHTLIYDLTVLLIVLLLLYTTPGPPVSTIRRFDVMIFIGIYGLLLASSIWPWLGPFWFVPVSLWISRNCGLSEAIHRSHT